MLTTVCFWFSRLPAATYTHMDFAEIDVTTPAPGDVPEASQCNC